MNSRIWNDFQISSHYMTGDRINKFGIFTISWLRSVCRNVKIRNKFIEIKYSVSNGLEIKYSVSNFVNFRQLNDRLFGKELFIRFTARAFRKLPSIYVFSYFPLGFEGRMWDLIPDHCLSFYFFIFITNYWWFRILEISRYRQSNGSVLKDTM